MTEEARYRGILAIIMLLATVVAAYHRWQAAAGGEKISWQAEGYGWAIGLRLAGLGLWLSTAAYLLLPASVAWARLPLIPGVRWAGAPLGLWAVGLMYWTLASLGKNLTDTVVTRAAARLVTWGPYRWVRHPYYVTAGLLILAATLVSANALIGLFGLTVMVLLVLRTPLEERRLVERFGPSYRDYCLQTGRFLPRLWPRTDRRG